MNGNSPRESINSFSWAIVIIKNDIIMKVGGGTMKKQIIWKIVFMLGLSPFLFALLLGVYTISVDTSWTWIEYLILYSFIYWPTYIVGLLFIILAIYKLRKNN